MIGLLVFGLVISLSSPNSLVKAGEWLIDAVRYRGGEGIVLFVILQVLVALSGLLPASLLGVVAGAIYGLASGFVLSAVSTLAGAVLAFLLCRSMFRPMIYNWVIGHPRFRNFDTLIARDGWKLVCLLRISPVMPFSVTSFMIGLSSIGQRDYFVGTLASLPALFGYVFMGTLANAGLSAWSTGASPIRWVLLVIGALATIILTVRLGQIAIKIRLAPQLANEDLAQTGDRWPEA